MSYSSLTKFITIRFRLHRVIPVYNNSSKDRLKVVDLSYFGSRTRKTTSLSHPLNELIVDIFIVPLFIQKCSFLLSLIFL